MDKGWIKLHRQMLNWEWYNDTNTFRVFMHLLLKANIKDSKYRGKIVKRGSVVTGRRALSIELGLSERQVRTALEHLEATSETTRVRHPEFSVIELNNFDKYQSTDQRNDLKTSTGMTTKRPPSDQEPTTYKEDKKEERRTTYTKGFEKFWSDYPKKWPGDKKKVFALWEQFTQKEKQDTIIGLSRWIKSDDWSKEAGRYIHKPYNFLAKQVYKLTPNTQTQCHEYF